MAGLVALRAEPIDPAELLRAVAAAAAGGHALFLGTTRNENRGRRVLRLEYGAYAEMALREMERLRAAALERFDVLEVALIHRTGVVEIGEASVGIAVSAAHRADAFDACRWLIDTLKTSVPIWKKESFEGGEVWIEGESGETPAGG